MIHLLIIGIAALGFFLVVSHWLVQHQAQGHLYTDLETIPANRVGLVLGTAPTLGGGLTNPYFRYRMEAAARLYKAGKVEHLIVSGDNSRKTYNEPAAMQEALIELGIPASHISLDYAGFRTLDSVVRAREIFQQNQFTIISQPFHNARAVFLARAKGINAIAFNAQKVQLGFWNKTLWRETLARAKAVVDVVLGKQPKFLGEKIELDFKK